MKTIFKLAIALLAVFSFAACSDVPMPYEEPGTGNTDNDSTSEGTYLDETFETSFGKFTNVTVKGNAWAIDYKTAKATGYDNSSQKTTASEAYLVSSPVDLSKSNAAYLQFEYILRYVRAGQTENKVLITDNYTGNPTTTTWTDITGTLTEGSDWTTFATYKKNIPAEFLGKSNVVIALMYSCTTTSSTIEIKNLIMKDGTVEESGTTTPETPATGEAKGSGTQADPYNAAAANKAASALSSSDKKENVYVTGIISKVGDFNSKFSELNYYISDDGKESSEQFYVYNGLGKDGAKFTSASDLKVGQKVTVVGTLINFQGNTPEFQYGSKIVSLEGEGSGTTDPETPATGEGVSISGTTVTLTNTAATAGTETATIDLNAQGYDNAQAVSEVKFSDGTTATFAKGNGSTDPAFYTKTKGVRVYLNNTITFNASKPIAKIVFTCDALSGTDYVGNKTATVTFSGNTAVYTNADPNATKGGVQLRVQTITITYAK